MDITMHTMAVDSYAPMMETLGAILEKAANNAGSAEADLVNARLAPDMFTLAQQVQMICHHARDGVARLTGQPAPEREDAQSSLSGMQAQLRSAAGSVRSVPAAAFAGAETRDCSVTIPNGMVIEMDGLQFLRAWSLPNFYFHVVTAYDILRHEGVAIGKQDYMSQVSAFIRPPAD